MQNILRSARLPIALVTLLAACGQVRDPGASLDPASMVRIADRTREAGDAPTAIGLYRRAHEVLPKDAAPLVGMGAALLDARAPREALDAYEAALKLQPENAEALRGKGAALLALGLPRLAIEPLALLAGRGVDPRVEGLLGLAYDMLGDHPQAQDRYRRGLAVDPNSVNLRNNLGLSFALGGDYPSAIATLRGVMETPGAGPRHRQNLALVYGLDGDIDKAAAVARLDLDEPAVKRNMAYYALLRGETPEGRRNAVFALTRKDRAN